MVAVSRWALFVASALLAVPVAGPRAQTQEGRWYEPSQVAHGGTLFQQHCAVCHGERAGRQGAPRAPPGADHAPPPLDGAGHAWHHPFRILANRIKFGSAQGAGMKGFNDVLGDQDIIAVIAWIQSLWPDAIYAAWARVDARSRGVGRKP